LRSPLRYFIFVIAFIFFQDKALSQTRSLDSLKQVLSSAKQDTSRCSALLLMIELESESETSLKYCDQVLKICEANLQTETNKGLKEFYIKTSASVLNSLGVYYNNQDDMKNALVYYNKSLKLWKEIDNKKGIATSYNNIGLVYSYQGDVTEALEYHSRSLKIRQELGDKIGIAESFNNMGYVYYNKGEVSAALDNFHKSLKMQEETGDKAGMSRSLNNIGHIYGGQGDTIKCLEYYEKSLKLRTELGYQLGIASCLGNMAAIYYGSGKVEKALEYYGNALIIQEKIQDKSGIARTYDKLGFIYGRRNELEKARSYYEKSLKIQEEIKDQQGMAYTLDNAAQLMMRINKLPEALNYAKKSFQISQALAYPDNIRTSAAILKRIYQKQSNYKDAFAMFELEIKMRDSISNTETKKASIKKQLQYDYEKKELLLKAEQDKKDLIAAEELKQKEKERNYFIGGFALVVILALFILRGYRQKQKDNKLIMQQKLLVEVKQKEILDSIRYAKKIQNALICSEANFEKIMNKLQD
jgi:tetratricopeptide (TPR) repeat protein